MAKPQIHFEVHGRKASSWAVQKVCDDKSSAIDTAKNLFKSLNLKAVKVLEVKYDSSDPVFHDTIVYFDGEKAKSSQTTTADLIGPVCTKPDDLYLPAARQSISKLLQKPLAGWKITPLELLYHQGHLQKLNDTGQILQGAVQRAAVSHVQKTGQKVNERVLDLYGFTNTVLQELKKLTVEGHIPEIVEDDLIGVLKLAKETEDWRKSFMMSFARHLQEVSTLDEKFEKIISYVLRYDDPDILQMLDRHLADFVSSPAILQTLMGEDKNLGEGMLSLIGFIRGSKGVNKTEHAGTKRINMLIRDKNLPETKQVLVLRLIETLTGNQSFVKGDPFKSVAYHSKILSKLHIAAGEHIGGQDTVDALHMRCERMTGSITIGTMLDGIDAPLDRVERLLQVNKGIIGEVNTRAIAIYILPLLENPQNVKLISEQKGPVLATLAMLRDFQIKVQQSSFQQYFSDKMLTALDEIAVEIMTSKNVLGSLARGARDNIHLGLSLLQLISEDKMTMPKSMTMVRAFAKKTIMSETFMAALEEKAKDGTSQADLFRQFYALLERTGLK
ncbi:MAG: hypothetical protein JKY12_00495 [Sneathiella sp.]|nr:hypothetical protein [Sneathiella sp.]